MISSGLREMLCSYADSPHYTIENQTCHHIINERNRYHDVEWISVIQTWIHHSEQVRRGGSLDCQSKSIRAIKWTAHGPVENRTLEIRHDCHTTQIREHTT